MEDYVELGASVMFRQDKYYPNDPTTFSHHNLLLPLKSPPNLQPDGHLLSISERDDSHSNFHMPKFRPLICRPAPLTGFNAGRSQILFLIFSFLILATSPSISTCGFTKKANHLIYGLHECGTRDADLHMFLFCWFALSVV